MINKPKISVIILVYHDEKYLQNCVASLKHSAEIAKIKLEIIISVNDSTLRKKNFKFPSGCKILFNKKNIGFGKSINLASERAFSDWLLIINVDTITDKNTLSNMLNHASNNMVGIIAPKILNPDGSIQFSILDELTLWNIFKEQSYLYKLFPLIFRSSQSTKSIYKFTHEVPFIAGTCMLIRNIVFIKSGGFDNRYFIYFEDYDLCKKVRNLGYKIIYENNSTLIHYSHQSFGGITNGMIYIDSLTKYLIKYYSKNYSRIALVLIFMGSLLRIIFWGVTALVNNTSNSRIKEKDKLFYNKNILTSVIKYF